MMSKESDPLVLHLVVRESLGLSPGKLAAQAGHAVRLLMQAHRRPDMDLYHVEWMNAVAEWMVEANPRILTKGADEKEWAKILALPNVYVQVDQGLTELPPNTATVIAVPPMRMSERPPVLKRMRLLT